LYEEAVAFSEVSNYQTTLPNGLHSIIQIARNNHWTKNTSDCCTVEKVLEESGEEATPGCTSCGGYANMVPVDCNGHIIGDYEIAYYRPYFDLQWEYSGWMKSSYYNCHYSPV